MITSIAKRTMRLLGVYDMVRNLYFRAKLFRAKTSLEVSGIEKTFWTTTLSMYDRILYAGGEKQQLEEFINQIRKGDTVWDIGAYVGMFSIFASDAVGSDGKVYVFEPEPKSFKLLRSNCQLNKADNATLFNFALGNHNEEGYIYPSNAANDSVAIHSLKPGDRLMAEGSQTSIFNGDYLVQEKNVRPPNVIKLDVEGAEFQVLCGMSHTLSNPDLRFMVMEVHPDSLPVFGSSVQEIRTLLSEAGFTITRELERGAEIHFICEKK